MKSNNIYLRKLNVNDAKSHYLEWLSNKETNRYLTARLSKHSTKSLKEFIKKFDQKSNFLFGIFDLKSRLHIGNITLSINPYKVGYFGYLIGEKKYWGTTAATEAMCILLDFSFNKMKVRKIWGTICATNIPALFNVNRFGFKREGILREETIDLGKVADVYYYGLLKKEWNISKIKFKNFKRIIKI